MHPAFTHVPPSPQVVPAGDGFTKSKHAVFAPSFAASFAAAKPPDPPPMTTTSYSYSWSPLHAIPPVASVAAPSNALANGPTVDAPDEDSNHRFDAAVVNAGTSNPVTARNPRRRVRVSIELIVSVRMRRRRRPRALVRRRMSCPCCRF